MKPITWETLSAFGKAAIDLDAELSAYDKLGADIERSDLDSEKGLQKLQELLKSVDEKRAELGAQMQKFAQHLQNARERCDQVEGLVTLKTNELSSRLLLADGLFKRFQMLGEMVSAITESLGALKKPENEELSGEEKAAMVGRLPEFNEKIAVLINEAGKLVNDARDAKLKTLEQNADAMKQTLQSAKNKFNLYIEKHAQNSSTVH